jgi:hypothetical protein
MLRKVPLVAKVKTFIFFADSIGSILHPMMFKSKEDFTFHTERRKIEGKRSNEAFMAMLVDGWGGGGGGWPTPQP